MLIALLLTATAPAFDPLRFFAGRTHGEGQLKVVLRARTPVSVQGTGHMDADTLVLDQAVTEGTKPPRRRQWRLRKVASDRYEGTLTDARDSVVGEVAGPVLHLRFTSSGGFQVQQWLTLTADGRTAINHLEARRLGIVVARLDERIVKLD